MRGYANLKFTCFEDNLETVSNTIEKVLKIGGPTNRDWSVAACGRGERDIYFPAPPKGIFYKDKILLWEPTSKPGSTVFFSNTSDGWVSLVHILSNIHGLASYKVIMSDYLSDNEPQNSFIYQKGKDIRVIGALLDNKWEFAQYGDPLWFEDLANYKKRQIKDRVNYPIIAGYLKKLGWDIDSDAFWQSQPGRRICFDEL